jgi:hypothetical protein
MTTLLRREMTRRAARLYSEMSATDSLRAVGERMGLFWLKLKILCNIAFDD